MPFLSAHPNSQSFILLNLFTFKFRAAVFAVAFAPVVASAEDVAFSSAQKSLDEEKSAERSRKSSSVAIFGGTTQDQSADMQIEGIPYDLDSVGGSVHMGIRVGYEWRARRWPIATGLEFEGSFLSTELNGDVDPSFAGSLEDESITSFHTDMNSVMFFFNGRISLDLRRYRARVGPFLSKLRPYGGGGVGGAQIWFNNTDLTTLDPESTANAAPFATDQFVFGHQWFAGVEYRVNDKVTVFGEFKEINLDSFEETNDLKHSSWLAGVKINYDHKVEADEP